MSPRILPGVLVSGKNLSVEMLKAGWVTTYEQVSHLQGSFGYLTPMNTTRLVQNTGNPLKKSFYAWKQKLSKATISSI